jgi:threonine dehydrogenase-like Zn-dependent dehydrogenase
MKALVIPSLSGPDALTIKDVPEPTAQPGQTLIRVAAGGLNFADVMTTKGGYPGTPPPPKKSRPTPTCSGPSPITGPTNKPPPSPSTISPPTWPTGRPE